MSDVLRSPSLADFEAEFGALLGRNDFAAAAAAAERWRAARPSDRAGWFFGSIAALLEDRKDVALQLIDEYLARNQGDSQCLLQKAECLMALGRRADAVAAAVSAAATAADVATLNGIAQFLLNAREQNLALAVFDQAIAAHPENVALLGRRAVLQRFLGDLSLAERDYRAVLALSPGDADALKGLVELHRQSPERNSISVLQAALQAAKPGSSDTAALHFALAKSYEDLGEYATSWRHLSSGNRFERAHFTYDRGTDRAVIERIIAGFPDVEPLLPDVTGERPIFIVGLPRTGTTLLERIIGSHSQVHSAGELPALSEAIGRAVSRVAPLKSRTWLGFAESLGELDGEPIAREYLLRSAPQRGDRPRFSDKQPTNFLYCALILRAFPNAHIVHVTRQPVAACYSIYKTRFDAGFPFAYDLEELGDFYVGYRQLMAHWHRVLPGRILDVAYEDVVVSLEPTVRRLFEYLDLPFETASLEFHLSPAPMTTTASSVQVRQPLYDSSLQQWRNYAAQLAPLRARLEAAGIRVE
jgi:tetratricopeptide (TPR) repeat protein